MAMMQSLYVFEEEKNKMKEIAVPLIILINYTKTLFSSGSVNIVNIFNNSTIFTSPMAIILLNIVLEKICYIQ